MRPSVRARPRPYRQGIALMPDDRKLDEALGRFQSAATLDPDSVLPLAGLAEVQRRKIS